MQDCNIVYLLINFNQSITRSGASWHRRLNNVDELKWCLIDVWQVCSRLSLTRLPMNGGSN